MRLFRMPGNFGTGLLVGLGAATLVPIAARVLSTAGKPMLKEVIKGGIVAMDKGKELYTEARSSITQVTTEAKTESSASTEQPDNS